MIKLTERQQQVLQCISDYIEQTGFPPTRADIARELGFRSANAAEDHLKALARKGAIEMISGASRGIRLVGEVDTPPSGLPIIGKVAAGSPILAQQHIENYAEVSHQLFSPRADYLLRVQGDSMIDAGILDHDLVAVHSAKDANNGDIVVARIDEDVTVKRLKKQRKQILLMAENEDYEPIKVTEQSGEFSIEGLVVGVIRSQL